MEIKNIFDAAIYADLKTFLQYYSKDKLNLVRELSDINLLCAALTVEDSENNHNKVDIIRFLIAEGIDVNFICVKSKRNALHYLFNNILRADASFYLDVTTLLVENGININYKDSYGSIPLSPAICVNKLKTEEMKPVYEYLLEHGCDYMSKDNYGNSCIEYSEKFIWRNDFIEIVKEFEGGHR